MAIFDAEGLPDHATHAVSAAIQIQARLWQLTRANRQTLQMRMGIHTGEVVYGTVGTQPWLNHTEIGDAVTLARYLQELATSDTILVSVGTHNQLNRQQLAAAKIQVRYWGDVAFKWKEHTTKIYEVNAG